MFGYYLFGGIQREVILRVLDPLHIRHVYHTTPQVQPVARLETRISIANGRTAAFDGTSGCIFWMQRNRDNIGGNSSEIIGWRDA